MVGPPDQGMRCHCGGEEQNRDGNKCFNAGIIKTEMKENANQDAACAKGYAFGRCLKPVIDIRKPDDPNATKQIEKHANANKK